MKSFVLILFGICGLAMTATGTNQVSDALVFRGEIIDIKSLNIKKVLPTVDIPNFQVSSTNNYKGYEATWAVFHNCLYLISIRGKVEGEPKELWNEKLFKGVKFPVKVKDWSGVAEQRIRPSEGSEFIFEIKFEKGVVKKISYEKSGARLKKIKDQKGSDTKTPKT